MIALWQVSVRAAAASEERVVAQLEERLQTSVAVYRDEDTGGIGISAYLEKLDASPGQLRAALVQELGVSPRSITITRLRRENWATSWKRHFKPIQIGSRLLVKPSWSRCRARPGQRVVILDPGLSFGTGQHATTAFCLRHLTRCRCAGSVQSFLDVGTGSGILAIAAAKLGYAPVAAFDFDPEAVRTAQGNARKNRIDDRVSLSRLDLTAMPMGRAGRFDVICANLTYDLLSEQAEKLAHWLAPGGQLIVAGILADQFPIVTKSFQQFGLTLGKAELKNIWRSGQFAFRCRVQRRRAVK